ncbi:MAG TPA: EAL domain-containing protein [Rhodocyclaceae bacterium]|nr:EAL domain-containing protein [Rhodocyclaceae bacterium]
MTSKTLADIMTRQIAEVASDTPLGEAAERMGRANSEVLLVIDKTEPIGFFTEHNLLLSLQRGLAPQTPVKDLLITPLVKAAQSLDYRAGHRLMTQANVGHLLVVDIDGRPAGIVSDSKFQQHLSADFLARLSCAGDVMNHDFPVLTLHDSVADALALIEEHAATCLIVVKDIAGRIPAGIFTEHHAMRLSCNGRPLEATPLIDVMQPVSETIGVNLGLQDALTQMQRQQVEYLVVAGEAGQIIGILTAQDVARAIEDTLHDHYQHDQRRKVQELLENEEKFRALLQLMPIGITITDPHGKLIETNRISERIFGIKREDQLLRDINKPAWEIIRPDGTQMPAEEFAGVRALAENRSVENIEMGVRRPDGNIVWLSVSSMPIPLDDYGVAIVYTDITEQRRVAGEMYKLSNAVEHSPVLTIITDTLGNIEYVNPRFTQITGYAAEEVIGQNPRLLKSGQTTPDVFADLWKTLNQGGTWTGELCNRKKNGELYWEDARILPIVAADGRITHFLGLKEDITLRRQAENRQRLATSVFDNSHEGIIITDPDNLIIDVNNAFVALSGYSREELIGQTPSMLKSGKHDGAYYSTIHQALEKHGQWRGEITNRKKNGNISVEQITVSAVRDDKGRLLHYIGIFTDITKLRESQQRLEHLTHFDPLTHLPNRALLGDRLQQALAVARRGNSLLAVCYLDLDDFKPINDIHGSVIGNELLTEVASRIKGSLRGGDTVARLGGDEFVLLLGEISDLAEIEQTLSRILTLVAVPYHVSGIQLQVTASIGVTIAPTDGSDPDSLVRHADQAMYVAKQAGRNRYHLFDIQGDEKVRLQHDTQTRISLALELQEFLLYYQPKVNMRTGKVTGLEALIRWQHPERGLLLPQEFLPFIEGHENIVAIGEWVMREALRQVCTWAESGLELPVSVNIDAHHLQQPGFVAKLADLLTEMKQTFPALQPEWLELEILETAALEDMSYVAQVIKDGMRLGVGFAIDDFGTGYSSLTYLKQLQANTLKIDQSFIRDMLEDNDDLAIVEGVVGLTTAFQRSVIAEGVETIQHGMMLMHLGCDLAQGYGIARPMPAAAVPLWVESFQPSPAWQDSLSRPWKREDFPLLALELDHRNWVTCLLEALHSQHKHLLDESFFDHNLCRFGVWYNSHGTNKFGHLDEFIAIGRLHEHAYRIGARIAQLYSSNAGRLAEELIPELYAANEDLFSGLSELRREMADQEQLIHLHWAGSRVN